MIIPTYNHALYLKKALQSVREQSYKNFEVIVVNNYSQDDTVQVVRDAHIDNLKLINYRNRGSIAAARNKGATVATGDYICFLDSDDEWYENKLKEAYNAISKTFCDIYTHAEDWVIEGQNRKTKIYGPVEKFNKYEMIFGSNCLSTSAVTISKNLFAKLNGFNESSDIILAEDYELWIRASLENAKCYFDERVLGIYRIHASNSSKRKNKHRRSELRVLEMHKDSIALSKLRLNFLYYKRLLRINMGFVKRTIFS